MKILADESVDRPIVERLRESDYDVEYIAEIEPGISDQDVLEIANKTKAILLTADKDFGELVYRDHYDIGAGVVLLRFAGLSPAEKADKAIDAIREFTSDDESRFLVVTKSGIRYRSK